MRQIHLFSSLLLTSLLILSSSGSFGTGEEDAALGAQTIHRHGPYVKWVARYNGSEDYNDLAKAAAIDASGNVYVTGLSFTGIASDDYATVKYDALGNELWASRYGGAANQADHAAAIALDSDGYVYVTGASEGIGTSWDYATLKYDPDGTKVWVARYDGPGNGEDAATAVAVDSAGNVYVTGASRDSLTADDYATIKYDAAGNELWVARYDGPGNADDAAVSLAVDSTGNVYVTGGSRDSLTACDYTTIKYDADGNELWVACYDGPESADDAAACLSIDPAGNIHVTGSSSDSLTAADYATIKYDADGNELWVARYDGPGNGDDAATSLATDSTGNVYVTGSSEDSLTSLDYATIMYDAAGNEIWVARFDGPASGDDAATSIAVDTTGNVYVTGSSPDSLTAGDYATIKYDEYGNELWVILFDGPVGGEDAATAVAVDSAGNVYVTGASRDSLTADDYATIKYDPAGSELWVARYDASTLDLNDRAWATAVDTAGNVYVTGQTFVSDVSSDYSTLKYDSAGFKMWSARYDGPGNGVDAAYDLDVDPAGSVYITGESEGNGTDYDYATIKYDVDGNETWVARYDGPSNLEDHSYAMAVDSAGNVYTTGASEGSGTGYDYATIKYDAYGSEIWVARYNGPGNIADYAEAIAVDSNGNVYVTGYSNGTTSASDYATIKYDALGNEIWVARYNGPGNNVDYAYSMALDDSGNVLVTGDSWGSGTGHDYATVKYDVNGAEVWVSRYNGPAGNSDYANDIAVDSTGNVYVTGASFGDGTQRDYATLKYDPYGNEMWLARYDGPASWLDGASELVLDAAGSVYVTGASYGSGTYDYTTIKYDSDGNEHWVARYDGPGSAADYAYSIALDNAGSIYVTGYSGGNGTAWDYATIKYAQNPPAFKMTVER
jgi:uncharacterized delta-60 repeat protein